MQKCAHLVELEKCCQTHIFLQIFVLIQPRTSLPKIYIILQKKLILPMASALPTHSRSRDESETMGGEFEVEGEEEEEEEA